MRAGRDEFISTQAGSQASKRAVARQGLSTADKKVIYWLSWRLRLAADTDDGGELVSSLAGQMDEETAGGGSKEILH